MSKPKHLDRIISLLKKEVKQFEEPVGTEVSNKTKDPFQVLISCLLSLISSLLYFDEYSFT